MSRGGQTTRWWWVRHAPVKGRDGTIYGQTDLPIDPPLAAAIRPLSNALPKDAVWITSDLQRTQQTAALFAEHHPNSANAIREPDFGEMDFGEWEGVPRNHLSPEEQRDFVADIVNTGPPGGESFGDVVGRVVAAVARHTENLAGRDVVVVGHSGSIKAALTLGAGVTPKSTLAFVVDPLGLTRLEHTSDGHEAHWSITLVNGLGT